jgi:hypothetical protein
MKRFFFLLTLISMTFKVYGEDTGSAAAISAETAQESNWKNWVFAASALVTAAIGVVIISLNTGNTSHDNQE